MNKSNKKPTAHLVCGFIGAGKTTFSKKLEKETGALRFTKDEWMIRIFGNNPKKINQFEKYDNRMMNLSIDTAIECLKAGIDVIIDDAHWIKADRKLISEKVKKAGGTPQFYYIKCSWNTLKNRTLERSKNLGKDAFYIDEEMFNSYKKHFEEFGSDEECIVINND